MIGLVLQLLLFLGLVVPLAQVLQVLLSVRAPGDPSVSAESSPHPDVLAAAVAAVIQEPLSLQVWQLLLVA